MNTKTKNSLWIGAALGVAACLAIGSAMWLVLRARAASREAEMADAAQVAQQGWQLWQGGRFGEAIPKFQQAVKRAPDDANSWNGLGWASFNAGKAQEAENAFLTAVKLQPNHPAALNGLGQIYLAQRKYDQAEGYLLKAAPQAPAAWYGLARLYLLEGKFDEAEEFARKLVDSGQADEVAKRMLVAARKRELSDALRVVIEPPAPH